MANHHVHVNVHIGNHGRRTSTGRSLGGSTSGGRRRGSGRSMGRRRKYNTYAGSKPGSGRNFSALKSSLNRKGVRNPGALAAYIGRRKYGRSGMARMAATGRRRGKRRG